PGADDADTGRYGLEAELKPFTAERRQGRQALEDDHVREHTWEQAAYCKRLWRTWPAPGTPARDPSRRRPGAAPAAATLAVIARAGTTQPSSAAAGTARLHRIHLLQRRQQRIRRQVARHRHATGGDDHRGAGQAHALAQIVVARHRVLAVGFGHLAAVLGIGQRLAPVLRAPDRHHQTVVRGIDPHTREGQAFDGDAAFVVRGEVLV